MNTPASKQPARLAVFISGGGRTLINLAAQIEQGKLRAKIALVVASRPCKGADWAKQAGLDTRIIHPKQLTEASVAELLESAQADYAVLAGFLHLLPIPQGWESRITNIHPALLPEFGGHGMYGHHVHEAVIAAGRKQSGCTVHLCSREYDRGPILAQATCPVLPTDTPDTLAARVFDLECDLYPKALEQLIEGRVELPGVNSTRH